MPNWLKITLKVFGALVILLLILLIGASVYITNNKTKVLAMVNAELYKNIDGKFVIGDMETSFFKGFPGISLSLKNVLIQDNRWAQHHHTLLDAKHFNVSLNAAALLKGTVSINHIDIDNAAIDLYTDSSGYSNTSVFKKGVNKKTTGNNKSGSSLQLAKFSLADVSFAINDQYAKKLFNFNIDELKGKMLYPDSGWSARLHLDVKSKSLAFNTVNGSFIKNQQITSDLVAGYNEKSGKISVTSNNFDIGGAVFNLNALFLTAGKSANFAFHLTCDQITWKHASSLVAANIEKTLIKFNLDKPIAITAKIEGSFSGGDPYLYITANVANNRLSIPGGTINDCNFKGVFTNNYINGKGLADSNSIIRLRRFSGRYSNIPFLIDTGSIINLDRPTATGDFSSSFPIANLNELLGGKVAKFGNGTAEMKFHYRADVVDFRINKPIVKGVINLKNADISYIPRNFTLKNTSLSLNFTGEDLILNNIRLQSGKSLVLMEGRVNNFLNLYYNAPEKILLTWQIKSPELHLGEFLGFLGSRQHTQKTATKNSGNIIDQLSTVLDKGRAEMHIKVDKVYYKKFLATDATADLILSEDGLIMKDINVKHAGGSLKMNGDLIQGPASNKFILSAIVSNVNIHEFFYAFDNFGLKAITYQNLKGFLSSKAQVKGQIDNAGNVVSNSMNGMVSINLKNGALINYNPLKTVGKFAFPFRDLNNIRIPALDARFDIHGDKIVINPMKITSSVINMDIAGTYGLTKGTNIALDVPLRNPKNDTAIVDKAELAKQRYKGIVLHILAKDDETGKLKIGWNKNHK